MGYEGCTNERATYSNLGSASGEIQTASSRIWTRIIDSLSDDDNGSVTRNLLNDP